MQDTQCLIQNQTLRKICSILPVNSPLFYINKGGNDSDEPLAGHSVCEQCSDPNGLNLAKNMCDTGSRGVTEVWSFRGANPTTFSTSRALALMASAREALKSSSGSTLAATASSSVSATDAGVFSWRAKGQGLELRSPGLEAGSDFKVARVETTLLSYGC